MLTSRPTPALIRPVNRQQLTNPQTRTEYSSIKVVDVSQVIVNGGDAVIKASNFAPERAKDLTVIRESDGRWLVEFFA